MPWQSQWHTRSCRASAQELLQLRSLNQQLVTGQGPGFCQLKALSVGLSYDVGASSVDPALLRWRRRRREGLPDGSTDVVRIDVEDSSGVRGAKLRDASSTELAFWPSLCWAMHSTIAQ